jgi:outer membrane lipoprotein-sorting protein
MPRKNEGVSQTHRSPVPQLRHAPATARILLVAGLLCPLVPMASAFAQGAPLSIQPSAQPRAPARPAPSLSAQGGAIPLPPPRPAEFGRAAPAAPAAVAPGGPAPAVTPAALNPSLPATPQAALERVNAYLNSLSALTGDFVQMGADGRRSQGRFSLLKPGRLRFDYAPPARLEIVADGRSVAIRDRRLNTQDLYSIGQTPLKFLLKERVDLARDTRVLDVANRPDAIRVTLEDRSTFGGTSRITLIYDPVQSVLTQWSVVDPQGLETTVVLSNLSSDRRPEASLFAIDYSRVLENRER